MEGLTDEQKRYLDERFKQMEKDLDAKYAAKARDFRAWIVANPLPAARVIGVVCLAAGAMAGYWVHVLGLL